MEVVKGSGFSIEHTFYKKWTGDETTSEPANLTGATIKTIVKIRASDPDSAALINKVGTITDAVNGKAITSYSGADTNGLSYSTLYYESVAKLADGATFVRGGVRKLTLLPNVLKTLF